MIESLTYKEFGERLGISPEAARKKSRTLRLPVALGNDGKARISVDIDDIQPARRPDVRQPASAPQPNPVLELQTQIELLRAEIARRATEHSVMTAELAGVRALVASERQRAEDAIADRDAWQRSAERSWWRRLVG